MAAGPGFGYVAAGDTVVGDMAVGGTAVAGDMVVGGTAAGIAAAGDMVVAGDTADAGIRFNRSLSIERH
jgi:hypothetical protein